MVGADGGSQRTTADARKIRPAKRRLFQRVPATVGVYQGASNRSRIPGRVRSGRPRGHTDKLCQGRDMEGGLSRRSGTSECYRAAAQEGSIYAKMMPLPQSVGPPKGTHLRSKE